MYEIIVGRGAKEREKFGTKGTILLGKQYVKMGQTTSLANEVFMDISGAHVVFICGKRGSGKCLTGDTLITLEDGRQVPIKELENYEGKVMSLNLETKQIVSSQVTNFFKRKVSRILTLQIGNKKIEATPEHPFLTKNGWIPASLLSEGNILATCRKEEIENSELFQKQLLLQWEKLSKIEEKRGEFDVYDITVPEHHNFIANDIIVHNSYTMGAIAEGLANADPDIKQNLSMLILDTMGIYWTMKYPNHKEEEMLKEWGFESKPLDVTIFTPGGFFERFKEEGIPTDYPFYIMPSELNAEDWCLAFSIDINSPAGVLLERTINDLKKKGEFGINDIISAIKSDEESEKHDRDLLAAQFLKTEQWGLFSDEATPIENLVSAGKVSILDVSAYSAMGGSWAIKALVIGLVCQKLFTKRMVARKAEEYKAVESALHYFGETVEKKQEEPLVWVVLDEAHEVLPNKGKTAATGALVTILREGRQPGISLILASQQPGKIHTDVMTQSDIVISHQLTAKIDVDALSMLMQSYMREGLDRMLDNLPKTKGSALVFDDVNERIFPIKVRPRFTWHGGGSPTAIKEEKKLLGF